MMPTLTQEPQVTKKPLSTTMPFPLNLSTAQHMALQEAPVLKQELQLFEEAHQFAYSNALQPAASMAPLTVHQNRLPSAALLKSYQLILLNASQPGPLNSSQPSPPTASKTLKLESEATSIKQKPQHDYLKQAPLTFL